MGFTCAGVLALLSIFCVCQAILIPSNHRVRSFKKDVLQLGTKDADTECREVIKIGHGTITSPHYPLKYPINTDCTWIIGTKRTQTSIIFNDVETEPNYDNITIRGTSPRGPIIATFSGTQGQCHWITYLGRIVVRFMSDTSVGKQGFSADYSIGNHAQVMQCETQTVEEGKREAGHPKWTPPQG